MTAPFAALEQRVNAAVMRRLANATGTLNGAAVSGVFRRSYAETLGMATTEPSFTMLATTPATMQGATLVIGSETWRVRTVEPDGTGMVRLGLEFAA